MRAETAHGLSVAAHLSQPSDWPSQRIETALGSELFAAALSRKHATLQGFDECGGRAATPNFPLSNKSNPQIIPGNPRGQFLSSSMRYRPETRHRRQRSEGFRLGLEGPGGWSGMGGRARASLRVPVRSRPRPARPVPLLEVGFGKAAQRYLRRPWQGRRPSLGGQFRSGGSALSAAAETAVDSRARAPGIALACQHRAGLPDLAASG